MIAPKILSIVAISLSLIGVSVLTLIDGQVTSLDFVSRLNEINAPYQFAANGIFLLLGIFWMGTVDTTRRTFERIGLDSWLRFSVIAYAASYILSMIFPCDAGCPKTGSLNQMIHNSLVWILYAGPAVFAGRIIRITDDRPAKNMAGLLLTVFVILQFDSIIWNIAPGMWQRVYELMFCWLWWGHLNYLSKRSEQ